MTSTQQILTVTFPVSQTDKKRSLNVSGTFVKVLYCRTPIKITADNNKPVLLSSGQAYQFKNQFKLLQCENPSVVGFTAYLLIDSAEPKEEAGIKRTSFFTLLNFNGTTQNFFGWAIVEGLVCRRKALRIVNTTAGILPVASDGILGDSAYAGTGAPLPQNFDTGWMETDGFFQINSAGAVTAIIMQLWEPIATQ